ncbi:10181_t:CDS:2, partial [Gigaspora rosea]
MGEKTYNGIHSPLQTSGNSNSVWRNGKDDNTVSISSDLGDYSMGCQNVETSCRQDHRNGGELACSPNHSKPHIFDERTDIRNEQTSSNDKSENDANIVFECSNHEKIKELQSSLGKLFRDSTLVCSTWTKKTAGTPCHLVLPNDELKNKEDSSSVESDSCRMATSLCLDLQTEDPEENTKMELQCYVMDVKQFGFNHIIIIGKRYCGMLFMDCFGRVFDWDSDGHALWSLGDYFDIISKEESEKNYDDRTAWDVLRDGTVFVLHK